MWYAGGWGQVVAYVCTILYKGLRTLGFDTHSLVQEPVSMDTEVKQ